MGRQTDKTNLIFPIENTGGNIKTEKNEKKKQLKDSKIKRQMIANQSVQHSDNHSEEDRYNSNRNGDGR